MLAAMPAPLQMTSAARPNRDQVAALIPACARVNLARMQKSAVFQACGSSCAKISCRASSACKWCSSSDARYVVGDCPLSSSVWARYSI
mmetsp:Transcript_10883/g.17945  ORF Transcript_10883/g.17945 Transcript_10883/m.17945 type:complete len:89 (-) Transcript_10883:48-314(-)